MRVDDRPLPLHVPHPPTHPVMSGWPIYPVVLVEPKPKMLEWDDPLLMWDDATLTWDEQVVLEEWANLSCDVSEVATLIGQPDDRHLYDAGTALVQVANDNGQWSRYNTDGSLSDFGPGRHLAIVATDGVNAWWLFYGRIARWDEVDLDHIEIEAFDSFSDLAQQIGTYTAGTNGDPVSLRLRRIMALLRYFDLMRLDVGNVRLTAQETDVSPLEEMQKVAGSDGGILYVDSDGTVVYENRSWRNGRSDQVTFPVVSDNVCTAPTIIWNPTLSTSDRGLADTVRLENIAKLVATAINPKPSGLYVLAETEQQWTLQGEGDALALHLIEQQEPTLALDDFELYLHDPEQQQLWRAVDWRIGDRLRFLHDSRSIGGGLSRLDLITLTETVRHTINATAWTMTVSTTKAVGFIAAVNWDTTPYAWDDTAPEAVWGY